MSIPPATLASATPRRQNSSCDPCRRSKRRCTFPITLDSPGPACTHCQRLGHACTFEFATSRLNSKARQKQRKRRNTLENINHSKPSDRTIEPSSLGSENVFDEWLNLENDSSENDAGSPNQTYLTGDSISGPGVTIDGHRGNQITLVPRNLRKEHSSLSMSTGSLLGISRRSPIHLLNSKLDATMLEARLLQIFNSIVGGCASRYLDYNCNLYATQTRYQIEGSTSTRSTSPERNALDQSHKEHTISDSISNSRLQADEPSTPLHLNNESTAITPAIQGSSNNMTLLGSARFLDHLAGLYGNKLNSTARTQSDNALNAVLRVFALQWMPLLHSSPDTRSLSDRDSCLETYTDAWFHARSQINAIQHIRSFRVVLTILMFDGTAIPTKAHISLGGIEHEFLDMGLRTLCILNELVMQYCATLGPFSRYAALAEASLSLLRWCGYMRDLGAALTADYECKLPALFARGSDLENDELASVQPIYHGLRGLDSKVPLICHRASVQSICIWRQIVDLRGALFNLEDATSGIPTEISEAIHEVVRAVQGFHDLFQPFMHDCTECLGGLSLSSKVSVVSMITFWSFGVLVLADALLPFAEEINHFCHPGLFSELQVCRRVAISSIAHIIKNVSSLPSEASFNIQNGLNADVPLIAYHITPSLMTSALAKALEHSVDLYNTDFDEAWNDRIDAFVKGIMSLNVTIGGSQTAGVAFQSLMQRYGDIISDSWSCD
ncbi:hypothetical protein N7520_011187 [Penicillium odoratum]|uniref:uncharacterized protein n=1 Tax=Penicillium odoratum TaxID=1167516 RepID=UPI002546B5F9|nr:uncharacterized protein N7520_011187 [Penicillium odoratum]KAJ5746005.1 hypothetical protein N7520_011187 [Penicillium odoratum]